MSGASLNMYAQKKQLVTPGELLAQGDYYPDLNTFKIGDSVYSTILGISDLIGNRLSVVPFKHSYIPFVGDLVIGTIVDIGMSGWSVDINSPYPALLPATEVLNRQHSQRTESDRIFSVGDLVKAKVIAFDRTRDPLLTVKDRGLGKVTHGRVMKISASKIPRLIGKEGSMISMLKKESSCSLSVGQNGIVLVTCESRENEELVMDVVRMIEREAHTHGLTDRVLDLIKKGRKGGKVVEGEGT